MERLSHFGFEWVEEKNLGGEKGVIKSKRG